MQQDSVKELLKLARAKKIDKARSFFLENIEGEHNMLLWKCYLSHIAGKKRDCPKKERIALLGSSNITPLKDMLKAVFHAHKVDTDYYVGEYNNYMQELISGASSLYKFNPSMALIVLSIQDILPRIYEQPFSYSPEALKQILSKAVGDIRAALEQYLSLLPKSAVYLAIIPSLEEPCEYVYSPGFIYKSEAHFLKFYESIYELEQKQENLFLLDSRRLIQRCPADKIEDRRYWYLGGMRYTDLFFSGIAKEVAALYDMSRSPSKKCLVVDLDNTLWGGIVGQDGIENIVLGQDGLGRAYQDFQREILKLHDKGIMLAICSKNNRQDAEEVLDKHPGMVLKQKHFISKRINWKDKAASIAEIAKEINIGTDSIVFLDDDPAQRRWVRESLPQVTVPELPSDSFLYPGFLKDSKWFDSYRLSKEDFSRNITYKAIAKGRKLKAKSKDFNSYLKSLEQKVRLERVNSSTISRSVQLCQKTNQFNMLTKRYQAADIKKMMQYKDYSLYIVRVKDCFCDYGIVGLLILKGLDSRHTIKIDTFLLSCRIIGRKIEFVLLDWLKKKYQKKGFERIEGWYQESANKKNAICRDVYKDNGFEGPKQLGKGNYGYLYKLKQKNFSPYTKLIKVTP